MDVSILDQGLLKRNPRLTAEEFSHHWLTKHAPLVVPFFLHSGAQHYEQIHGPLRPASDSTLDLDALISSHDGAVSLPPAEVMPHLFSGMPKWKEDYYREIILVDERNFLVSEAMDHIHRVPPMSVEGIRKVVIENGKCLIEVGEEIWRVWREYESRGNT